jgi:hypothetical protein
MGDQNEKGVSSTSTVIVAPEEPVEASQLPQYPRGVSQPPQIFIATPSGNDNSLGIAVGQLITKVEVLSERLDEIEKKVDEINSKVDHLEKIEAFLIKIDKAILWIKSRKP